MRMIATLSIPFQNWMIITFVLILIGELINIGEKR